MTRTIVAIVNYFAIVLRAICEHNLIHLSVCQIEKSIGDARICMRWFCRLVVFVSVYICTFASSSHVAVATAAAAAAAVAIAIAISVDAAAIAAGVADVLAWVGRDETTHTECVVVCVMFPMDFLRSHDDHLTSKYTHRNQAHYLY